MSIEIVSGDSVPALLIMSVVVVILAFLRIGVPRLIERFQTKKPIAGDEEEK